MYVTHKPEYGHQENPVNQVRVILSAVGGDLSNMSEGIGRREIQRLRLEKYLRLTREIVGQLGGDFIEVDWYLEEFEKFCANLPQTREDFAWTTMRLQEVQQLLAILPKGEWVKKEVDINPG